MEQFRPPLPLLLTGNLSETWRRWEQRFRLYMTATGALEKDEKVKTAILLHAIGEEALEVYNTLTVTPAGDALAMEDILKVFKEYCSPQKNVVFERHKFWSYSMSAGVTVDRYVTELRQKSKSCEFGVNEDDMIRDKLVFSINDTRLKERLLRDNDLTLRKTIEICRSAEVAKSQIQAMQSTTVAQDTSVDALRKTPGYIKSGHSKNKPSNNKQTVCYRCGNKHALRQCPAYGATCHRCGKNNHFSKVCRAGAEKSRNYKKTKTINNIETDGDSLYIGMVCSDKHKTGRWHESVTIGDVSVTFKLDTGADANVLPRSVYNKLPGMPRLQPTKTALIAFGGARIRADGVVSLECEARKHKAVFDFLVSDQADKPILGGQACEELHLVKRVETLAIPSTITKLAKPPSTKEELVEMYADVFTGLGEFPGVHHIHTDSNATPVIHACRNVPLSIMDPLKKTLQDLQNRDVITPVNEPTDWVNSLVATQKKNGTLRVCLDPCDLNQAVKRQHYSIPTHEDVRSKLAGKSIFTILDEKDGYWQIKLDEPSSKLCTFNTPWGRYRFLRLPFGIKSASEVFQQKNCETFGSIPGVFIIADDMIIAATSEHEHDEILQKVMQKARAANVKFNKDKIQFKVDTVKYMGHIITAAGQKADVSKIKAIVDMPTPEDKQSLQRLLGMTKFLAQYIQNEASLTAPLRQLLKKDTAWQWQPHHTAALQMLKATLTQAPVLRFYDHKKPLTLQADSSKDGLGACLLQEGQPVCYASRALTDTEKRYAQIEKELLAIVFATKRFHQYVYGRPVTVQSDHKPLEAIMRKPLCKAPARLQGMLLQLQRYDLTVTYTPGKDMFIADALSRATTTSDSENVSENTNEERVVYALEATAALSEKTLSGLRTAVAADSVLQAVRERHLNGWPARRKSLDRTLHSYWPMRNNISIHNDIIMIGDKIVIPQSFRQVILEKLHFAHQGVQRTKARARRVLYWPGMSHDIETMLEKCQQCQQMQPKNQAEPLIPHQIPELPWMKIGADIFELNGQPYLLLVDYLSKYPEVLNLPDKTAHSVIQKMKSVFARHGIPKEIVSDHVPFTSYEMRSFAASWEIKLTFSSPGFPSSNGMAERAIKTVKHALKKAARTGTDPHLVLLSLRNTPVTGLSVSPAQMLMGRVLRSTLPCASAVLRQSTPQNIPDKVRGLQSKRKYHFDQHARPLPVLTSGDTVHMQTRRGWEPAVVAHRREEPRSYTVQTPEGEVLRRNRRHLRKIHPSLFKDTSMDPDDLSAHTQEPVVPPASDTPQHSRPASTDNTPTCYTRSGRAIIRPARYRD
ncbi:unnamed protein product [Oreochromis niloticus]|nr:unnamed protein product [Mustela putorius furo]